ncbi:hypothetical protein BJ989_002911 [Nocardioides perillae]|uniref:Uncharacterized protein n=1 Tax=Nocardioides perillae TaxID=1119534 RepID=A0A7Y9UMX7_9ACTN|nr:hypothetical protein [Nocardioides perillae]
MLLDQVGSVLACFAVYSIVVGTAWLVWRRRTPVTEAAH